MRIAAAQALGKVGSTASEEAIAALKTATNDGEDRVRRAALQGSLSIKVQVYLQKGRSAEGKAALLKYLQDFPKDDQARFGLAVLQFIRGVERLGQSLYKYGAMSENTNIPFLRLPVPKNASPAAITYSDFREILDDFRNDLSEVEATLAGVSDESVKLPLRLAAVRLDLNGDSEATQSLIEILKKIILQQQFHFLQENRDFLVCFDRGDVAWLRAYCHLLMGMLDFYLAFDTELLFDLSADDLFAKVKNSFKGNENEKNRKRMEAWKVIAVKEPFQLGRFRKHLIKVAEMNRKTWKHIRAETDDDYEWLPNAKQHGVLGLPVRDHMIDAWLAMMAELEALLDGKRTFPKELGFFSNFGKNGKGLNLKSLFDDPPKEFDFEKGFPLNLPDKYWSEGKEMDTNILWHVFLVFGDPSAVAYAAWFN